MHFSTTALIAVSASLAAAAPAPFRHQYGGPPKTAPGKGDWTGSQGYPPSGTGPSGAGESVFSFPLSNGFPNIANPSAQLTAIELQALGTLPNGPPPPSLAADDATSLKLIAFNEISEVAFFTELLYNITNNVAGYTFADQSFRQTVINAITAVQAQEELHALNANGALAHFGFAPIQPCQYAFPVSDFTSAIGLAATFTDVVLGTLQDVQTHFGTNGDIGLIRPVGSVIGQEGEQNGFYRNILGKVPSALPFLTTSTREFAFSALNQDFVVAGTCPNSNTIPLPIFGALTVVTSPIAAQDQTLTFSFTSAQYYNQVSSLSLAYINQQNVPVSEPLTVVSTNGQTVTVTANFPYSANEMNGLTIAAVVKGAGPFADAPSVAAATVFGPGLIEIN